MRGQLLSGVKCRRVSYIRCVFKQELQSLLTLRLSRFRWDKEGHTVYKQIISLSREWESSWGCWSVWCRWRCCCWLRMPPQGLVSLPFREKEKISPPFISWSSIFNGNHKYLHINDNIIFISEQCHAYMYHAYTHTCIHAYTHVYIVLTCSEFEINRHDELKYF